MFSGLPPKADLNLRVDEYTTEINRDGPRRPPRGCPAPPTLRERRHRRLARRLVAFDPRAFEP